MRPLENFQYQRIKNFVYQPKTNWCGGGVPSCAQICIQKQNHEYKPMADKAGKARGPFLKPFSIMALLEEQTESYSNLWSFMVSVA